MATLYPQVREAEVNLQWLWEEAPGGPLLLEDKVDVVVTGERAGGTGILLWDYKTTQQPDPGAEMRAYRWQMQLYALLYRRCFGIVPDGTVLYFMRELAKPHPSFRPPPACHVRDDRHRAGRRADAGLAAPGAGAGRSLPHHGELGSAGGGAGPPPHVQRLPGSLELPFCPHALPLCGRGSWPRTRTGRV